MTEVSKLFRKPLFYYGLNCMTERSMTQIVKEGCEPDDVIIIIGYFRDSRIRASPMLFSVFRISSETLQHPIGRFDYPTRVLQAIIAGTGVDEMSQA